MKGNRYDETLLIGRCDYTVPFQLFSMFAHAANWSWACSWPQSVLRSLTVLELDNVAWCEWIDERINGSINRVDLTHWCCIIDMSVTHSVQISANSIQDHSHDYFHIVFGDLTVKHIYNNYTWDRSPTSPASIVSNSFFRVLIKSIITNRKCKWKSLNASRFTVKRGVNDSMRKARKKKRKTRKSIDTEIMSN